MRLLRFATYFISLLTIFVVSCTASKDALKQGTADQRNVSELLSEIPANNQDESRWVFSELVELGPGAIHYLTSMLTPADLGTDTQARFALNGLAKYVSRPGNEPERSMYERVLLDELKADHHPAVKVFLMEQLELTGSNQAVPVLGSLIGDDQLHESAVHALRAINTTESQQVLLDKLSQTQGAERLVIIKSLGDMEVSSASAAKRLISYIPTGNVEQQRVVWYALAQTGNPAVKQKLKTALESHSVAQRYYLLFAKRLAEEGHSDESSEICRNLLSGDYSSNVKSSAITILAKNEGEAASDQLLAAATGSDNRLRSTVFFVISQHSDWKIWETLISNLDGYNPTVQADVIQALGQNKQAQITELRPFLDSSDQSVRIAATNALAMLDNNQEVLPDLLEHLVNAEDPKEIESIKNALLQMPTESLISSATNILPTVSGQAKISVIQILAERRATENLNTVLNQLDSSDKTVRLAVYKSLVRLTTPEKLSAVIQLLQESNEKDEIHAIQDAIIDISAKIPESQNRATPVINSLEEFTQSDKKGYLLKVLPQIGGDEALEVITNATDSTDTTIRNAAIEALVNWEQSNAISPLLEAFQNAPDSKRKSILNAYVRLVNASKYSSTDKIEFLEEAYAETSSANEKQTVLKGFAEIRTPEAVRVVVPHFQADNEAVKDQALQSAANILLNLDGEPDQFLSVLETTISPQIRSDIEQYIGELKEERRESEYFTSLFNGQDLSGWIGDEESYAVENGHLVSLPGASGNLFTEEEYSDFILRFEFKLTPGANNGLGIRSPLEGNPAYNAIELQILDNNADQYGDLQPYQYHGSVYGVAAAERGYLKPAGEWNTQEVIANGSHITVKVNGQMILNTNIENASTPAPVDGKDHPGLLRTDGHIGFLGHGDEVAFRNIRIRDLTQYLPDYSTSNGNGDGMNQPPEGFKALFNGNNLEGWKGLVGNPESRAKMSDKELKKAQMEANEQMREHWFVRDGVLHFDGDGESLVTQKKYKDFEMLVDWKIEPGGDSGIYLRGSPQVQIWDITEWPQGSGGLYNNQNHLSEPLVAADNAIGEWNRMRIKMIGEKVTVHLNDQLVVPGVVLENYWNRDKPIYSEGQIELQSHSTPLYFKNIFIREIPRQQSLLNGNDLTGWERVGGQAGGWNVTNGVLYTEGGGEKWEKGEGGGWLSTAETYDDFKLQLEYRLPEGGNSGIFLRAPHKGDPAYQGLEIQLLDDYATQYEGLEPWQYTGSIYNVKAPSKSVQANAGQWHKMEIIANGPKIKVTLNGTTLINTTLINFMDRVDEHPGLKRRSGHIGLQNHNSKVEFRNIKITDLN